MKVPSNWKSFLPVNENKSELFSYLARKITESNTSGKVIVNTLQEKVLVSPPVINVDNLEPCNHEEADTRIFLHVKHAKGDGYRKVIIRTVDTDVVVLATSYFFQLEAEEIWIAFGVGNHFRYIPIHTIANKIGRTKCAALAVFHALSGCDTTSYFAGRKKRNVGSMECVS